MNIEFEILKRKILILSMRPFPKWWRMPPLVMEEIFDYYMVYPMFGFEIHSNIK